MCVCSHESIHYVRTSAFLPVFEVCLQVTSWHAEGADWGQRARHRQLVQQLVHQYAGSAACLQLQPCPVQGTEVPLLEEATQAAGAEGVSTWRVQRLHQRLQADVAHQVVVHLQPVVVKMVLPAAVDLATLRTQSLRSWLHWTHLATGAAHLCSFDATQLWHKWLQWGSSVGNTHSYPISFTGWTSCREDRCPPVADGTSPCRSECKTRGLNSCFGKTTSVWLCTRAFIHVANALFTCSRVSAWDCVRLGSGTACVCACVCVSECVEIMYCCSCPLIWQYNLSFALACCNLPIPQRGNYLGLRQREDTDQRKSGSGKQQRGENRASERSRGTEWGWRNERKKQSYYSFVFLIRFCVVFLV